MNQLEVTVIGVDVAKAKLDIFNSDTKQHSIIKNAREEIQNYINQIRNQHRKLLIVMEATGGYESLLVEILHQADLPCSVFNPLQIRNFARGCGLIEKNDKLDAAIIAKFGEVVRPKITEKPGENEAKLRALVHRRESADFRVDQNHADDERQSPGTQLLSGSGSSDNCHVAGRAP